MKSVSVFWLIFATGVFIACPFLGSVGLFDPWETHYVEVARQMLARKDLIYPYWQNAYFFSKPPLLMWMSIPGLFLSGAQGWGTSASGALPVNLEWFLRLPNALLGIFAGALLAKTTEVFSTRRAGLLAGFVFLTMPMSNFMFRQLMTDTPFVSLVLISLCAGLLAQHLGSSKYWIFSLVSVGLAVLAKGLLGFLPLFLMGASHLLTREKPKQFHWYLALIPFAVAGPWYTSMLRFTQRDEENKLFVERFFLHDHFNRFAAGVHSTTDGNFTYFIEQGAWAIFPWVVMVPLALFHFFSLKKEQLEFKLAFPFALLSAATFALFSFSATRFHHYVFPMIPGLAVLTGLSLDSFLLEPKKHINSMVLGLVAVVLCAKDVWRTPKHFFDLFSYNHERPWPLETMQRAVFPHYFQEANFSQFLIFLAALVVTGFALMLWKQKLAQQIFLSAVLGTSLLLSWFYWRETGIHNTQKTLIANYVSSANPQEPLVAFLMNWKGETFYTKNQVIQLMNPDGVALNQILQKQQRTFFVVEHSRLAILRNLIPGNYSLTPIAPETMNKFVLAMAAPL
jgi:hypothetical protein